MAKPLRYRETQIQGVRESVVNVDQPNIGGVGQMNLTTPHNMPDLPDLAGLSNSLAKTYITLKAKDNEEQQNLGFSQAAQDANRHDWNTLVREGLIPEGANPYFITGYRQMIARRYGAEEADDIINKHSAATQEYNIKSKTGNSQNLRLDTPNVEEVIRSATDSKYNHTNILNPTLMADPYFQKELADYRARVIPQVREKLREDNIKSFQDAAKHNMALEGRNILEAYAVGKATSEDFGKWIEGVYRIGIKDPHDFAFEVVNGVTHVALNRVDEDGDTIDPEGVMSMLSKLGTLEVNKVQIAKGTQSDKFFALSEKVRRSIDGGGGSAGRFEKFMRRQYLNPESAISQVSRARSAEEAADLAAKGFVSILEDKTIPTRFVNDYRNKINEAASQWKAVDARQLKISLAELSSAADAGDMDKVDKILGGLPVHERPDAQKLVKERTDASFALIQSNPEYKQLEEDIGSITKTNELVDNYAFNNFKLRADRELKSSFLTDYRNAKTEAEKEKVVLSFKERMDNSKKQVQEEAIKMNAEVKALRLELTGNALKHVSSLDKIIEMAKAGKLTPAQEKEFREIDAKNVDLRETLDSGDFLKYAGEMATNEIAALQTNDTLMKLHGYEGKNLAYETDGGKTYLDMEGIALRQKAVQYAVKKVRGLMDEGKIRDKSELHKAMYFSMQEFLYPSTNAPSPEKPEATKPTEVAAVKPVVSPVKPDPYKREEDIRQGLEELATVSGLSKLEDEYSKNKESAEKLDNLVAEANRKILEDMKAGIVYPNKNELLLRLNKSKGLDAHMLASKGETILFGTDTPTKFERLPSTTYEETPLFKTKDSMKDFFSGIGTPETRSRVDRLFSMMDLKYSNEEEFMSLVKRFIQYQNSVMRKFQGENK